ncbi:MAG: prolipoprotein diacylglyceryl transferase family protein [bacterium]
MFPRILHIYGPLWIHGYGMMIAVGFLIFIYFLYNNSIRKKIISDEILFNTLFLGLMSGIIGGRLITIIYEWNSFSENIWQIFYPWIGGFGILGSILGVMITVPIYLKIKKVPVMELFDIIAIYAGLLEGFGRFGCLFAGCCHGMPAKCFCSIIFTNPNGLAPLNIPLHPAQIYSSLASFLVFIFMFYRAKYFEYKKGELLFTFLMLSSFFRFLIDFVRGDRDFIAEFHTISYYQTIAILIFIFSFISFIVARKK